MPLGWLRHLVVDPGLAELGVNRVRVLGRGERRTRVVIGTAGVDHGGSGLVRRGDVDRRLEGGGAFRGGDVADHDVPHQDSLADPVVAADKADTCRAQ